MADRLCISSNSSSNKKGVTASWQSQTYWCFHQLQLLITAVTDIDCEYWYQERGRGME